MRNYEYPEDSVPWSYSLTHSFTHSVCLYTAILFYTFDKTRTYNHKNFRIYKPICVPEINSNLIQNVCKVWNIRTAPHPSANIQLFHHLILISFCFSALSHLPKPPPPPVFFSRGFVDGCGQVAVNLGRGKTVLIQVTRGEDGKRFIQIFRCWKELLLSIQQRDDDNCWADGRMDYISPDEWTAAYGSHNLPPWKAKTGSTVVWFFSLLFTTPPTLWRLTCYFILA